MDLGVESGGRPNHRRWIGQGMGVCAAGGEGGRREGGGVLVAGTEILEYLMGTGRENGRHPNLRR